MPASGKDDVTTWIKALPDEVTEVRIHAGARKDSLSAIGIHRMPKGTSSPASAADAILSQVADADVGLKFRCFAHSDTGKVLSTRYFSDGAESTEGGGVLEREGPVKTIEDAAWRMATILERALDKSTTSNERLVMAFAQPLTALAGLFKNESERRESAETALMEKMAELVELNALASQAADRLEAGSSPTSDPLREAAAEAVRQIFPTMGGGKKTPKTETEE